ncbi:hypothetical protein PGN35_009030 [Nodosilinea sp. PGN35]|uniref:hypothetical protein n=1 Tax=Nodosilinea sp. PGN35 TaxID=3020489 RepID=UPI0023B27406|nr:hypothetical protein [Nodosilinea sp. TSF1-S3]MDF0367877.1 hypothetical protein [Nodosilinea sp. TSF1-S3]
MISYEETKRTVLSLLANIPTFGPERLPAAAHDYQRLIPAITSEVISYTASPEQSKRHNHDYRVVLLRIVSIECAAGASVERCRTWFYCLASLSAWIPSDTTQPVNIGESAIWAALAGRFDDPAFANWVNDPNTKSISDRVVYRLLTGKSVDVQTPKPLFEESFWKDLCSALETKQSELASFTFQAIADWWLSEYQSCETPAYDPENFSTFEPAPNAALAVALIRDQMQIQLHQLAHRRFYYVALMLADDLRR